jgi:hypothetical protein
MEKSAQAWFPQALTLLFIALKLTDEIAWHWAWVLSPMWISFTVALLVGAIKGYRAAVRKQARL